MSFNVPWMIGGGVEHEVEVARLLAHAATSGAEGIAKPNALRPTPLDTPGTKIRINSGAALIPNRYPGGHQQTYIARLPISQQVDITSTGSAGGRSDLVVARIEDPQYSGPVPPDVQTFEYARIEVIEGVPANTKSALDLNLSYPAIGIARIDLPKNTGTIQAEHIVDVREVAQPRKERYLFVYPLVQSDGDIRLNTTDTDGQAWPHPFVTNWQVTIPHWAQRVRMIANWGGVLLNKTNQRSYGRIWIRLGRSGVPNYIDSQHTSWSIESEQYSNVREAWVGGDDKYVNTDLRGRTIDVYLRGRVNSTGSGASKPVLDNLSVLSCDIEFYETRD